MADLVLRHARLAGPGGEGRLADLEIAAGRVAALHESGRAPRTSAEVDLEGRLLLPGLVNAHDHLDLAALPALGRPPYRNAGEWRRDVDASADDPAVLAALRLPAAGRLLLGGLRNLLAGATAVAHHGPYHRSLQAAGFPVRVLSRYQFASSPGLEPRLRRTYRTTDRRVPWLVHAGEGVDEASRLELDRLAEANVLRQNTVVIHAVAFGSAEAERLAAARAAVVWCPEANRRLYGRSADLALLRRAGVRVGLGSDAPPTGVRDALSNLAAAAAAAALDEDELLALATVDSAEVARLPVGGFAAGAPADLVVTASLAALLAGDRRAVELVLVAGVARYGRPEWLAQLGVRASGLRVDGVPRALETGLAGRLARLRRSGGALGAGWLAGLTPDDADTAPGEPRGGGTIPGSFTREP